MKRTLYAPLLLGCLLLQFLVGCTDSRQSSNHWQEKLRQVRIGMSRGDVEKLLPPYPHTLLTASQTGGSQGLTYWLDPHWKVTICYDYTGLPRDQDGKALSSDSPDNKVLSLPVLTRENMPRIEIESIKVQENIEQSDEPDQ